MKPWYLAPPYLSILSAASLARELLLTWGLSQLRAHGHAMALSGIYFTIAVITTTATITTATSPLLDTDFHHHHHHFHSKPTLPPSLPLHHLTTTPLNLKKILLPLFKANSNELPECLQNLVTSPSLSSNCHLLSTM